MLTYTVMISPKAEPILSFSFTIETFPLRQLRMPLLPALKQEDTTSLKNCSVIVSSVISLLHGLDYTACCHALTRFGGLRRQLFQVNVEILFSDASVLLPPREWEVADPDILFHPDTFSHRKRSCRWWRDAVATLQDPATIYFSIVLF